MSEYTLNKKIVIDDDTYGITAVRSDSAGKVDNKLTVTVKNQGSDTSIAFDGQEAADFSVVSSEGGTYSGPVKITAPGNETIDVPTIGKVQDMVSELSGLPLQNWNGTSLESPVEVQENGTRIEPLKFIHGTEATREKFIDDIAKNSDAFYIYMAIDTVGSPYYSFYFISGAACTPISAKYLTPNVGDAVGQPDTYSYAYLKRTFENIRTAINALAKYDIFDNEDNGTQKIENKDLDAILSTISSLKTSNDTAHSTFSTNITNIQGILNSLGITTSGTAGTVARAANALLANVATQATNDSDGYTINTGYYQSDDTTNVNKIYISTYDPNNIPTGSTYNSIRTKANDAKNGDIWIVYDNT